MHTSSKPHAILLNTSSSTPFADDLRARIKQKVSDPGCGIPLPVILDDEPTRTHACHDIQDLMSWDVATLKSRFMSEVTKNVRGFFILTDSRALHPHEARELIRELCSGIRIVLRKYLTSRPVETEVASEALGKATPRVLAPFFLQDGGLRSHDIHYVDEESTCTLGRPLAGYSEGSVVIVRAASDSDMDVAVLGFSKNKEFVHRSSAALVFWTQRTSITVEAKEHLRSPENAKRVIREVKKIAVVEIENGQDVLIMTSRELVRGRNGVDPLNIGSTVAKAFDLVLRRSDVPARICYRKGVPLLECLEDASQWKGIPYIVFPGDVDFSDALSEVLDESQS
ncbi:hypothetical protein DOTSEDRAFT_92459 [Dothistroma septosporum NZE10]|uniref:Four-carbon acid sugar kinase N-terminal domain-containing protein n=1 Tax=Dothistroma septosporum (strain NZE10 / CBS 128990) TaxID=675120 RepID=N1PD92_DOTSN|nr:hypothetical protein DOTSEDRAFT_92459 [Dothistroma septosporum NZE10]